jgi:MFS family permease
LVGRFGSRPSLLISGVLLTTASVMLMFLTPGTPILSLLLVFAVYGIGFAMVNAPVTNAAVSGMPRDRAGAASAITSTSRQVGVSIGVALCGSVAGAALAATHVGFTESARPLWIINVVLGLVITVLAVTSTSARAKLSAQRLAPLIADGGIGVARAA